MKDNYKIRVPPKGAFTIQTEDDFIQMHSVILAVAKRGVGKSTMFGNLLRLMKDNNALHRLILVSGTFHNNKANFIELPLDIENDVIEPEKDTPELLMEILAEEGREYDSYHERIKMWNLLQKLMKLVKSI
jgi:Mrp family chromosome partitioning ATPase